MISTREEEIFETLAVTLDLDRRLRTLGQGDLSFDHVAAAAHPFLVATLSRYLPKSKENFWVICNTEREQERFYSELSSWVSNALLFPHLEVAAIEGAIPDPEVTAERLAVLQRIRESSGRWIIVLNEKSFDEQVYVANEIHSHSLRLTVGESIDRERLIAKIVGAGYERVGQVAERGQYSVRGGIVDIYAWQLAQPVRIEWFGDEIDSIREFDPDQQTSVLSLNECKLLLNLPEILSGELRNYRKKQDVVVSIEDSTPEADIFVRASASLTASGDLENFNTAFFDSPLRTENRDLTDPALKEACEGEIKAQLRVWINDGWNVLIHYKKESELIHFNTLTQDITLRKKSYCFKQSSSERTFTFPAGRVAVTSTAEIFGYHFSLTLGQSTNGRGRRSLTRRRTELNYSELTEGDLVVHLEHGLARYRGIEEHLKMVDRQGETERYSEEVMALEFADEAKLYVPLDQAYLVSRYVGIGKRGAALSKLGDGKWSAAKKAAEKSIYDYAAKLLKTQAQRDAHPGRIFKPDTAWQKEFEDAFPYKETADQITAIADTKHDMESGKPMDRLICGDVGFGKTEVAIRAAFKAANDGVQVAMMVPTTVLAQQHYENFHSRMANFPVRVELLSRYLTQAEQTQVTRGLADGSVDLVIGTHRLISKDVSFKNLGLLIVDEEQRFGVRHKERIKERFPAVDVLTLSATPIPRTLYLALTGARDLSTLETPPPSRYPVETLICGYDERIIRSAIDRELDRQGQVYFLHNRVESIERVRARIKHLCPRATVDLGHGQMEEGQLEEVMHRFVSGRTDVLVATTIIESGLDIPNANTIIIDRADRFGLADLYQLRGRVGRGQHKAYAYLMLPRDLMTVGEARKRINAIKQYSTLGAGFKIALRDLEIRGAGNILGLAQSGHLTAVGFDLYCQLLRQAVSKLRGEKVRARVEVALHLDFVASSEAEYARHSSFPANVGMVIERHTGGKLDDLPSLIPWPAFLPTHYIEDSALRVQAYRQLAAIAKVGDVDELQKGWRDRFGPLPVAADHLLALSRLKLAAAARKIQQIEVRGDKLMVSRAGEYVQSGGKFPRLTSPDPTHKMRQICHLIESL